MNVKDLRRLIREVLPPFLYSKEAEELIVLTVAAESNGGHYLYQMDGPARGIAQMEPATEKDILTNFVRFKPKLREVLIPYVLVGEDDFLSYSIPNPITYNLAYQILMTRIHYFRDKHPLPPADDIEGLASTWKRVYNTYKGKGTVAEAISKYKTYTRS